MLLWWHIRNNIYSSSDNKQLHQNKHLESGAFYVYFTEIIVNLCGCVLYQGALHSLQNTVLFKLWVDLFKCARHRFRLKRSQSTTFNLDDNLPEGEFKRGGVRATAGPRLGWSRDLQRVNE